MLLLSADTSHYKETECMRQAMEDVLYENGVDIVFNGHLHTVSRLHELALSCLHDA